MSPRCVLPYLLVALGGSVAWAAAPARPNVVVIVADDLGYADLGVQGCRDVPTPHIDSLARWGIRCTNGYVSGPVCSPTRAGLMTGRYQQRFGHEFNTGPVQQAGEEVGLPLGERTMAEYLKAAGYATGCVGKWHLGYAPAFHPLKRGFDEFYGFLGGAHSYLDSGVGTNHPILRGTQPVDEREYLTDALGREAVDFVRRHKERPFFLYLAFNAVHTPMHAVEKYRSRFPTIDDPQRQTFAAMLSAMDDAVGAVLAALRDAGVEENTLIFFLSDNGGPTPVNTSRNDPLRGRKGQVLEGGIRVPFLVQWKAQLPRGQVYEQPVVALDILPTALAAAAIAPPGDVPLDGVNLLPYLRGQRDAPPHEALYWRSGARRAVRSGDWKLVREGGQQWQLFHLGRDIGEANDLAAEHPDVVRQLTALYQAWDKQLAEPRWGSPQRPRPARPANP